MTYFLIILWFAFFCWLLTRKRILNGLHCKPWVIVVFLSLKVASGAAYGVFFKQMDNYQTNADTWAMQHDAQLETEWLLSDPVAFARDLTTPRYADDGGILATRNSMMNDLKEVVFIKMLAVFNLVSDGRYYVNVVIFNGLCALGLLCFCRAFVLAFGAKFILAAMLSLSVFPTVLFWTSGMHKDGLLLAISGFLLLCGVKILHRKMRLSWLLPMLFACGLFFLLRMHSFLIFLLAGACSFVLVRLNKKAVLWLMSLVLLAAAFLLWINPTLPAVWLAERRSEFLALSATDVVSDASFQGDWQGMLTFLPNAFAYGVLWPLPGMYSSLLAIVAGIENALVLLLIAAAFFTAIKLPLSQLQQQVTLFAVMYFLFTALLIGYTIPYLSPLLRYKSLVLPFVLAPSLGFLMLRYPNWPWWPKFLLTNHRKFYESD